VLWNAGHLDHREQALPNRRVEDRELAGLDRRPPRRRVRPNLRRLDATVEWAVAAAAD